MATLSLSLEIIWPSIRQLWHIFSLSRALRIFIVSLLWMTGRTVWCPSYRGLYL